MLQIMLFGVGRIGRIHAANLLDSKEVKLKYVYDIDVPLASKAACLYGATFATVQEGLSDPSIQAVVIASPTNTHADLITASAKAGKAIFCEKPIDLSVERSTACIEELKKSGVPVFLGFNRRFDPHFKTLVDRLRNGEIGEITQIIITSRDPSPPDTGYIKSSGGIFKDMTIHDFDTARWVLGEEPVKIVAFGNSVQSKEISALDDYEQVMINLETESGKMCHINNNRYSAYGYDQRIEVHGTKGRLIAHNPSPTCVEIATMSGVISEKPYPFFLERYKESYKREMESFISSVINKEEMKVKPEDGLKALLLAEAALLSVKKNQVVYLKK